MCYAAGGDKKASQSSLVPPFEKLGMNSSPFQPRPVGVHSTSWNCSGTLSDASLQPLPLAAWRENVKLHLNKTNVGKRGEREEKEEADRER